MDLTYTLGRQTHRTPDTRHTKRFMDIDPCRDTSLAGDEVRSLRDNQVSPSTQKLA